MYSLLALPLLPALLPLLPLVPTARAFGVQNYPNMFFDPTRVVDNSWFGGTDSRWAREMSQYWAETLMKSGPWSVTNKTVTAKSGDPKDYLSWAVYHWPDCSNVGNTTELTDEEIWDQCEYVTRDGELNPDTSYIQNNEALQNMSNSVYLSAMAYVHTSDSQFSQHINDALYTFFVNNDTAMNPNLEYSQVIRGPGDQLGRHTGVLDLACMAKVVSGVEVMKKLAPAEWSQETEDGVTAWATSQLDWLTTSDFGLEEKNSTNNHGTFYYNQLCSLQILLGQNDACATALEEFYSGIYLNQIVENGDQPLESARTRPYHYRAYNLMALITNARISDYVGLSPSGWDRRTSANTSIVDALAFAMGTSPADTNEVNQEKQLNPVVAAVAAKFGDPNGTYAEYLKESDPYFPGQPWFALNAGLSDAGIKQGLLETTYGAVPAQPTSSPEEPLDVYDRKRKREEWRPRGAGFPTAAPKL
ncbi:hypothetical protein IAT38_004468 [Cryptococcus sp. DSM 104549]